MVPAREKDKDEKWKTFLHDGAGPILSFYFILGGDSPGNQTSQGTISQLSSSADRAASREYKTYIEENMHNFSAVLL